jgi:uncharacterized protein involved in outer membrane biogenesis
LIHITLDEFYVNFRLSSLFRLSWTFGEIRLTHPTANVVRGANGQFNLANLIASEPAPPPNPAKQTKPPPAESMSNRCQGALTAR